jgi:hypothetical protein
VLDTHRSCLFNTKDQGKFPLTRAIRQCFLPLAVTHQYFHKFQSQPDTSSISPLGLLYVIGGWESHISTLNVKNFPTAPMRHVHFAPANAIYSPTPPTPSPTLSVSSLPSVSAPPTPPLQLPTLIHPRPLTEAELSPAPETSSGEMHIHFLLAFSPFEDPVLQYDLSLPPSSLANEISPEEFAEFATHPPLPTFHVTCSLLQWPITVSPSSGSRDFVTVLDVFESIYRNLRMPIHPAEYKNLPSPDATLDVNAAYYQRCGRIEDLDHRQLEESKGLKRVDFLTGRNRFLGLSGTLKGPDIWELNVA